MKESLSEAWYPCDMSVRGISNVPESGLDLELDVSLAFGGKLSSSNLCSMC